MKLFEVTGVLGDPLAAAQRQRVNAARDFLLHQEDLCAEGRLTIELVQQLSQDGFCRCVRDLSMQHAEQLPAKRQCRYSAK